MKKQAISILIGLALFVTGCTSSSHKQTGGDPEQKLVNVAEQKLAEGQKSFQLPAKYSSYQHLADMDKQFYYLSNSEDPKEWKYIKVRKNDPSDIIELPGIDNQLDTSLTFAYQGRFFVTTLEWGGDQNQCVYQIVELKESGEKSVLFSDKSSGLPGLQACGGYVICQPNKCINQKKHMDKIFLLDIKTGDSELVTSSTYEEKEDGRKTGTMITGLEWPRDTPSEEGFYFSMADLEDQNSINGDNGENQTLASYYYYSIKDAKLIRVGSSHSPADYIGGTERGCVVSEFASDTNDNSKNKLFLLKKGKLQEFIIPCDESFEGIMGSAALSNNRLLAYSADGFYILDLNNLTYVFKHFSVAADVMEQDEIKKLDYQDPVIGFSVCDDAFYFATATKGRIVIHEIK